MGIRAEIDRQVEFRHTLSAWRADLPPVLSTPNMIAWMEGACFEALQPFCEGDEINVGTAINVTHRAPTGIGASIKCEATLESLSGRFYIFRVSAHNGSEVIGHGTVSRAIVSKSKFSEKYGQTSASKAAQS